MTSARVRRFLGGVVVLAAASSLQAQVPTIEYVAGGIPTTDRPGTEVPLAPTKIVVGPDGRVYTTDFSRSAVTRFDPVNGTVTTLPQLTGSPQSLAFDAAGHLYVAQSSYLLRYNLSTNQYTLVGSGQLGSNISDIAIDGAGNVYVLDSQSNRVRVIRTTGQVESFAGTGTAGFSGDGGPALLATFNWPSAIAADNAGNVFISDSQNGRIRRISASTGIITTVAGTGNTTYNGEGLAALQTNIAAPGALLVRPDGSLLFSDRALYRVRRLSGGVITTVAGNGVYAFAGDGGAATAASIKTSDGLALDAAGNLYIGDTSNKRLRRVAASTGIISSVAGNGTYELCGDGGPAALACLDAPRSLHFDAAGDLAFADMYNGRVRRIVGGDGVISTVAGIDQDTPYPGDGGLGPNTSLGGQLWAIGRDPGGNLYAVVNYSPRRIYRIDAQTNVVTVFAGTGAFGFSGDGGPATAATFRTPTGIAFDAAGNAYISDNQANRIRKVAAGTGIITTFAGNGNTTPIGDGGLATAASLWVPSAMLFDAQGNMVVLDELHCRIRKIDMGTGIISTIAGNGSCTASGNAVPAATAAIGRPISIALSPAGELYFATYFTIRRINAAGIVTTVVGDGLPLNNPSNRAVQYPYGMAFDSVGRLYITGTSPDSIRRISGLPTPPPATDTTPPIIGPGWTGTLGKQGWYRSNIQLQWSVIDEESTVTSSSGCGNSSITSDTSGITFTCTATSAGGTGNVSVTFKRDTVAPTLAFGSPTPAPDVNGWNSGNVSIPFTAGDALSGVDSTSTGSPLSFTEEGTGITRQVTVTDLAGNTATFTSPAVNIDRSPPVIQSSISGTVGNNGWYRSDVQLSWTVTDPTSPINASHGCASSSVTSDTAGVTFTCTAVSGGGAGTKSVTIKRDTIAPTLAFAARTPAPDANGWNSGDVSIPFTASDALSGVASTSGGSPLVFSDEGAGLAQQVTVTDFAGNSTTITSPVVNIDRTAPVIQSNITGTAGNNGWYRGDVQLSWTVADTGSPVTSSGCASSSVTSDTAGVTFTCTATSGGGTSTKSVTIKRDATAPYVFFGNRTPTPYANGWNAGDVSIPFSAEDARSGVASSSSGSPLVFTGEGANLTQQVTVTDVAGNTATFTSPMVNIDRTAPVIDLSVTGAEGNDGWYRGDVQLTWTIDDLTQGSVISINSGCANRTVTADTAGITYTCNVTSNGGSSSRSVTVKRDATPPTLTFGAASPAADEAGWRAAPVSVPFEAADALSGVASTGSTNPLVITQTGTGVTGEVAVTDVAGNSVTFTSPAFNIDGTPPVLTHFVYGTQSGNGSGWYRTDARVVFHGADAEGSLVSYEGQCDTTLTTDSPGTTFTCTATSRGGSVTKSVTIKRDTTPPTLNWAAASPAANAIGWHTTDVSFAYTAADATSGLGGNSQGNDNPVLVQATGPGVGNQITVWDVAGNQATFATPPVNIDRFAPVVNYFVNGTPGNNGWYTGDVQVSWQVVKAPENIVSQTGCVDSAVTTDTAGTTFSCTVTSGAGTTSSSVTIKRDATAPALTFGTPSPAPNANGWNKTNVSIPFTRSDALSGLASTSATSPLVFSTEGANLTRQVTVTDNAGNTATYTTVPRSIDKTVPFAEMNTPEDGATYGFYQELAVDFWCTDLSLISCTGPTLNGEPVNTRTAGTRTYKVTAVDAAGFTTNHTHTYFVESAFNFGGFVGAASGSTPNLVTRGALVPIRWQLPDGRGGFASSTASFTSATVTTVSCSGAGVAYGGGTGSGATGIGYDAATHTFTYNWQTNAGWTGCRKVAIRLKDNVTREIVFRFQ